MKNILARPKGETLPIRISVATARRIERLARQSDVTVERWLDGVLAAAIAGDEQHFRDVATLAAARARVDRSAVATLLISPATGVRNGEAFTVEHMVDAIARATVEGEKRGFMKGRRS